MEMQKRHYAVGPVLGVYWQHLRRYPFTVFFALALTIAGFVFAVIIPLYFKKLVDLASTNTLPAEIVAQAMYTVLFTTFAIVICRMVSRRSGSFISSYVQPKLMRDIGQTAFAHLIDHSYLFFSNNFTGTLVRRVTRLQSAFELLMDRVLYDFIPMIVMIVGATVVLFMRSTIIGGIFLGWVVLFCIVQVGILRWKMKYDRVSSQKDSEATGILSDAVANEVTIKMFSGEDYERGLFKKVSDELADARFRTWRLNEYINILQAILMIGVEFILFYWLIELWEQGQATAGDFILVHAYVLAAIDRLWDLGNAMRKVNESFADAAEMVHILQTPHEVSDAPRAGRLAVSEGAISFNDVTFGFSDERQVLSNFNLAIRSREKVALIGPSGAGKTTITKLLIRFHDVTGGSITIDGQDIKLVTQESLRNAIAFVPQEPVLFHRTLMENIRYGRRDATDEEVIEAARQAHCHEFIMKTPQGFGTFVGERGIKLSGGERQRIAIARAILKDAPILILDEATSSLDSESEALIQDALTKLMEGKTVIAIAHRLSTVMKMDRIVVIEDGKVAMTGTHDELVRHEGGLYKKLWEIQAGGFIQDDIGETA